jgi:hypothetical protein
MGRLEPDGRPGVNGWTRALDANEFDEEADEDRRPFAAAGARSTAKPRSEAPPIDQEGLDH